jgi:hypothetical protein
MTRSLALLAVLTAGACTTAMNWRFSYQLGTTQFDSIIWATFSVALDISKWLMLPFAALAWPRHKVRAVAAASIWVMATLFSFGAAMGFAALNRANTVATQQQYIELRTTLATSLATMQASPRWRTSAACADATTAQSHTFCAHYREVVGQLNSLPPQEADPQSALLAKLTGMPEETVRLSLALFLATACEIISALGLFAILPAPATPAPAQQSTWTRVTWRREMRSAGPVPPNAAGKRWTAPQKWKSPR